MDNKSCKQLIDDLVNAGGEIIVDKSEGNPGFMGRIVQIKLGNCQFKISYMDMGSKEIVVQHTCYCQNQYECSNSLEWKNIPVKCLEKIKRKAG